MASTAQQVHVVSSLAPTADVVGCAFVQQYYLILHKSPELVYRFYQDHSLLSRPDENGIMSTTTTMEAINEKILSFDYGSQSADITTVDAQDSYSRGVLVLVTGHLTGANNSRKKFTQSFFLAPQDTGFYVFNDVFRFVDEAGNQNGDQTLVTDREAPLVAAPEHEPYIPQENHVSETEVAMSNDDGWGEICDTGDGEVSVEVEETPETTETEWVSEVPNDPQPVESIPKIEELPRKSYASILSSNNSKCVKFVTYKALKENIAPLPAPRPALLRTAPKNQEPIVAAPIPISIPVPEMIVISDTNINENLKDQEVEDGYSIYIRGLASTTTRASVESEFKKFGPIKANGIQVKFHKGFCFGFVEFESASAVQSAIEASPITINGRQAFVEEKRSTIRGGGGRGRFSSPRGNNNNNNNNGFRSEGMMNRGRGYGGGRGYGRADFGGRNGGRGGTYHRFENGNRVNRAGVLGSADNAVKSTAIQVPASA